MAALVKVLPSTMVASNACGSASRRATRAPVAGERLASWRVCHVPSEKRADSATAKKKLAPANTRTPTTAHNGVSMGEVSAKNHAGKRENWPGGWSGAGRANFSSSSSSSFS